MKKILTIVGARPQIIKASALSRKINDKFHNEIQEIILHTGQHYDPNMSDVFFKEMGIPEPKYNLNVGSGSHGHQTANIIKGVEDVLLLEKPDGLLVYGDTNSTLASSLAASKLGIPVFHVEAGLRSYNMEMPEEINRLLTDHISKILFCPTKEASINLNAEGFNTAMGVYPKRERTVFISGDIMYDNALYFSPISQAKSTILEQLGLEKEGFILFTMHRNNNTDDPIRLNQIISSILEIVENTGLQLVFPIHPRTQKSIKNNLDTQLYDALVAHKSIQMVAPTGYLDTISLLKNSKIVLTDSGGLQKESFFFKKPCVILRSESEWIELVENGNAILADADPHLIINAVGDLLTKTNYTYPEFYGDGDASGFIMTKIFEYYENQI
jgi:UDP-GlcNAc3NAcA epimerase